MLFFSLKNYYYYYFLNFSFKIETYILHFILYFFSLKGYIIFFLKKLKNYDANKANMLDWRRDVPLQKRHVGSWGSCFGAHSSYAQNLNV